MLAILGAIIGLFGSLLPEWLKFLNNKEDHKHEIEMGKLQMETVKLQGEIKLAELNATADVEEVKALYASAKPERSGVRLLDGIMLFYNSSVRPTITYAFMFTYMMVKYATFMSYTQAGYSWQQSVQAIWNGEDFAVFSTILGYWFGGRMMKWSLERVKGKK